MQKKARNSKKIFIFVSIVIAVLIAISTIITRKPPVGRTTEEE